MQGPTHTGQLTTSHLHQQQEADVVKGNKTPLENLQNSDWFSGRDGKNEFILCCHALLSAKSSDDGEVRSFTSGKYTVMTTNNSLRISRGNIENEGYKFRNLNELQKNLMLWLKTNNIQQPFSQNENNYNSAALCTVQLSQQQIPDSLTNYQNAWETGEEKLTRTPDGFVAVAKKIGLENAAAVVTKSADEYKRCIADAVSAGKPLIAPFIVDNGLYLTGEGVRTWSNHNYSIMTSESYWGKPITKSDSVTNIMCNPIENLINKSKTFDDFKKSVSNVMTLYKNPIPMPKEAGAGESKKAVEALSISMELVESTPLSQMTEKEFKENIDRPIREAQMAICTIGRSTIEQMSKETFESIKNRSKSIRDLVVNGDPLHSCVITNYNPVDDKVTIAHWNTTYTTTSAALYASSQLLPDALNGVLYTFHPASVGPSDLSALYS